MSPQTILELLKQWFPSSGIILSGFFCIYFMNKFFTYRNKKKLKSNMVFSQLFILTLSLILIVFIILSTPLSDDTKGNLLSFFGLIISAAIALSSTTFLGNIMAGFMIRTLQKFQPGDFLKIEDCLGRVTELGLLHTEIQTIDRDLIIMPNLLLVTKPLKVINDGTLVSMEVSLGYDIPREEIEKSLLRAAHNAKLESPFVHLKSLGDYSVLYKVSGILKDIKNLISSQSLLNTKVLDSLHQDQIEIVSPSFMNQRVFQCQTTFIPKIKHNMTSKEDDKVSDKIMFDKAEQAEEIEDIKNKIIELREQIKEEESSGKNKDKTERLKEKLKMLEKIIIPVESK